MRNEDKLEEQKCFLQKERAVHRHWKLENRQYGVQARLSNSGIGDRRHLVSYQQQPGVWCFACKILFVMEPRQRHKKGVQMACDGIKDI